MKLWHVALLAIVAVCLESLYDHSGWLILTKREGVVLIASVILFLVVPLSRKLDTFQPVKWCEYILPLTVGGLGLWGIMFLLTH